MRIAVAHHSLNIPGGAERLCLSVIEALKGRGHNVCLVSVEKTDWSIVRRNFGTVTLPDGEAYLTEIGISKHLSSIPVASAYFLAFVGQVLAKRSQRYDVTINTFGDIINSVADITYVHFPLRAAIEYSQVPAFSNKSMWKAIAPVYDMSVQALDIVFPGKLLTNSKFMQEIIKRILKREARVIYPPVNVEAFSQYYKDRKEGHVVVVIASYTPKRHLELVPMIARHSHSSKFVIIGKADQYSSTTIRNLKEQINKQNVENRVKLLTNIPIGELQHMLSMAKVYLHIMPYDHFGISVVEAMAAGCVPVVHRSGGPWRDILAEQDGNYGFSFNTAEEAGSIIESLVTDEDLRSEVASRAWNRARRFDKTIFEREIVEVAEQVAR